MKNLSKLRLSPWVALIFLLIFFSRDMSFHPRKALAQVAPPGGDVGPFVPTKEYNEARGLAGDTNIDQANQLLDQIIAQNPGTALAAEAILAKIKIIEDDMGVGPEATLYNQLIANFPGTRYEIYGKLGLIRSSRTARPGR